MKTTTNFLPFRFQGQTNDLPRRSDGAILYAAYGSNLHLAQMARRCPTAVPFCQGWLPGYKLRFRGGDGSAVATVEPATNGKVPVLIWAIREADLASLDRYEGWPTLYRRETMRFRLKGGGDLRALVYIMNPGRSLGRPHMDYLNTIVISYESAHFPTDTLLHAVLRSTPATQKEKEGLK